MLASVSCSYQSSNLCLFTPGRAFLLPAACSVVEYLGAGRAVTKLVESVTKCALPGRFWVSAPSRGALQAALDHVLRINEKGPCSAFLYGSTQGARMTIEGQISQFWTCGCQFDSLTSAFCAPGFLSAGFSAFLVSALCLVLLCNRLARGRCSVRAVRPCCLLDCAVSRRRHGSLPARSHWQREASRKMTLALAPWRVCHNHGKASAGVMVPCITPESRWRPHTHCTPGKGSFFSRTLTNGVGCLVGLLLLLKGVDPVGLLLVRLVLCLLGCPPNLLQKTVQGRPVASKALMFGRLRQILRPCTVAGTASLCKGRGVYLTLIRINHTSNVVILVSLRFRYSAMEVFMSEMSVQVTGLYDGLVERGEISQEEACALVALDADLEELERSLPVYLELPEQLSLFKGDARYQAGLPVGFLFYRDEQATHGSVEGGVLPSFWERDEILEMMHHSIHHPDPKQAALLPLAFNVGCMMGFLSALAVHQQEDAQAGLVLLNMMVSPLLVSSSVQALLSGVEASPAHGDVSSPRCAAPGCKNLLSVSRTGRPSRFCSGACRVRAHRAKA